MHQTRKFVWRSGIYFVFSYCSKRMDNLREIFLGSADSCSRHTMSSEFAVVGAGTLQLFNLADHSWCFYAALQPCRSLLVLLHLEQCVGYPTDSAVSYYSLPNHCLPFFAPRASKAAVATCSSRVPRKPSAASKVRRHNTFASRKIILNSYCYGRTTLGE